MGSFYSQEQYFYSERWPKESVDVLISTLVAESLYGKWEYEKNMANGLFNTKAILRRELGVLYSDEEIIEAIKLLSERFTVWKYLVQRPDVMIDNPSKNVRAKKSVWEAMIQEDTRVKWYGQDGEHAFDDLEVIFDNPWNGKDDYVHLGAVSGLHYVPGRRDETSPERAQAAAAGNNETFTPSPRGTLGQEGFITKQDFEKSVSARSDRYKKLFFVPESPISSVGSSSVPKESTYGKLLKKFNKSG